MAHILEVSDLQGLGLGVLLASSYGHGVDKKTVHKKTP